MMNVAGNTTPSPIYPRIREWSVFEWCCDERTAVCPDCGWSETLCVFCMDTCEGCGAPIF